MHDKCSNLSLGSGVLSPGLDEDFFMTKKTIKEKQEFLEYIKAKYPTSDEKLKDAIMSRRSSKKSEKVSKRNSKRNSKASLKGLHAGQDKRIHKHDDGSCLYSYMGDKCAIF